MKGNNSAVLRAMYIVLVPVVALIILLNSGYLQRFVPAASVNGESFSVVRYNYYYFDCYNSFLDENEDSLDQLGLDPSVSEAKQNYDENTTWKEYFQQQAEAKMAETAYFCDLAKQAGYQFSDQELAPVSEKLAANEKQRLASSIKKDNYYVSFYGVGMNEARYTQELTRAVEAQAYKAYLVRTYVPSASDEQAWLAANPEEEYRCADLRVITLAALPDRDTGKVGQPQLTALESKLSRLEERYQSGTSFEDLQKAFSTCTLGDDAGAVSGATSSDLPEVLSAWCLKDQDKLAPGDTFAVVDKDTGAAYFAVLDSFGSSGPQADAARALGSQSVDDQLKAALASGYQVKRNTFGMMLATT